MSRCWWIGLGAVALAAGVLGAASPATASGDSPVVVRVSCDPSPVAADGVAECTATVSGPTSSTPTPTGQVTWTSSGTGAFSYATCGALIPLYTQAPGPSWCGSRYTPSGAGSSARKDIVTASYSGDGTYEQASGSVSLGVVVKSTPFVTVVCDSPILETNSSECQVLLASGASGYGGVPASAPVPTGKVNVATSPAGLGVVLDSSCATLTKSAPGYSSCSFRYLPKGDGTDTRQDTIVASYVGDPRFTAATGRTTVSVRPRAVIDFSSLFTMFCSDNIGTIPAGGVDDCSVVVQPDSSRTFEPTGTLSAVATSSPKGTLSSGTCTVEADQQCDVTYTPSTAGPFPRRDDLEFTYSGDAHYRPATHLHRMFVDAKQVPVMQFGCGPNRVQLGHPTECLVSIQQAGDEYVDAYPSGIVNFSRMGYAMTSANGSFAPKSCTLMSTSPNGTVSYCTVVYTPTGTQARTDTIKASYPGDGFIFAAGTKTTTVQVVK